MLIVRDFRVAIRRLMLARGYTIAVLLTLGLTIGANAAMFGVVDAVLLRSTGIRDADRVAMFWGTSPADSLPVVELSYRNVEHVAQHSLTMSVISAMGSTSWPVVLEGSDTPVRLAAAAVSTSFFETLGAGPGLGRVFVPEDDADTAAGVVILSYHLWTTRFGRDPRIIGKTIALDKPHTIVGVMPAEFDFPRGTDLWTPVVPILRTSSARFNIDSLATVGILFGLGRLRPDVAPETAAAEIGAISGSLARDGGRAYGSGAVVTPLTTYVLGPIREALWALLAAVGLLLLIGASNVSGLMLTRVLQRQQEQSVKLALGATPADLVRPWVVEAVILCLFGGALGLMASSVMTSALVRLGAQDIPRLGSASLDRSVVFFTIIAAALAALVCAVTPARLAKGGVDPLGPSRDLGRASASKSSRRGRSVLVTVQIALSVMLLIGAALVLRSFANLRALDLGFTPSNVLTMGIEGRPEGSSANRWINEVLAEVGRLPGVEFAGAVTLRPLAAGAVGRDTWVILEGQTDSPRQRQSNPTMNHQVVGGNFFETLRVPLRSGRIFNADDRPERALVAVVSERTAHQLWPGQNPIGRRLFMPNPNAWRTVIGVVGDVRYRGLADLRFDVYESALQNGGFPRDLVVRTSGNPVALVPSIQSIVLRSNARAAIYGVTTMDAAVSAETAPWRFSLFVLGCFAVVAVVLSTVGLVGLVVLDVGQRRREFAIRLAIGARVDSVVRLVLSESAKRGGFALALGLLAAALGTSMLRSILFEVQVVDPLTYAAVAVFMFGLVCVASYVPARLGCRFDVAKSLRSE